LELPVFLPGMESGWRVIRVAFVVWRVFHRWMLDPPYLFLRARVMRANMNLDEC
jgi:hypothetical protein